VAIDYPYIQVFARKGNDATATINVQIQEEAYGVDQQAIVDAVKEVLSAGADLTVLTATRYEMNVATTQM
jgi:hypothetical protein